MMFWNRNCSLFEKENTINVIPLIILQRLILPTNSPEIRHYHEIAQRMEVIKIINLILKKIFSLLVGGLLSEIEKNKLFINNRTNFANILYICHYVSRQ